MTFTYATPDSSEISSSVGANDQQSDPDIAGRTVPSQRLPQSAADRTFVVSEPMPQGTAPVVYSADALRQLFSDRLFSLVSEKAGDGGGTFWFRGKTDS